MSENSRDEKWKVPTFFQVFVVFLQYFLHIYLSIHNWRSEVQNFYLNCQLLPINFSTFIWWNTSFSFSYLLSYPGSLLLYFSNSCSIHLLEYRQMLWSMWSVLVWVLSMFKACRQIQGGEASVWAGEAAGAGAGWWRGDGGGWAGGCWRRVTGCSSSAGIIHQWAAIHTPGDTHTVHSYSHAVTLIMDTLTLSSGMSQSHLIIHSHIHTITLLH